MGTIAKIVGQAIGTFLAKVAGALAIFHMGKAAQRGDDLKANQTVQKEAADARADALTDRDYAQRVRDRYTAD